MIDPKRVTPGFVLAYLKWAIPIFVTLLIFIFAWNVSGVLVAARDENRLGQEQQIMKLQNELQATRAATDTGNKNVTKVSVDAARLDSDKALIGDFLGIFFNVSGQDQYKSMLEVIHKQFGTTIADQASIGVNSGAENKLTSWQAFCETVYGTKYTWWCLVDFTVNGEQQQCWMEISVTDGTTIQVEKVSRISAPLVSSQ